MQSNRYPTTVYLSVPEMVRLIHRKGLSACIVGVAARIEREFFALEGVRQKRPRGLPL